MRIFDSLFLNVSSLFSSGQSVSDQTPNGLRLETDGINDSVHQWMNSSGRVDLDYLRQVAMVMEPEAFVTYMNAPVLAGSAVRRGNLVENQSDPMQRRRAKTLLFKAYDMLQEMAESENSESLKKAIYPLLKGDERSQTDPSTFAIGRDFNNDLVIPDFAISRDHASIRSTTGGYLLCDRASSNGTTLNGARVDEKGAILRNRDIITFGRYEFTFLEPHTLQSLLRNVDD